MQIQSKHEGYRLEKSIFREFEEVPPGWDFIKLKKVVLQSEKGAIKMGPFGSSLKKHELVETDGIKTIWIENIIDNEFNWDYKRYITREKYQELKEFTVKPNDIVITMMGTIGRAAVIPNDIGQAIISSHLLKLTLDQSKCLPKYMYHYLLSHFVERQLMRESRGIVMEGLNTRVIKSLLVKLPPIEEQEKIASILSKVDDLIQKIDEIIEQTLRLKKDLTNRLIIRGVSHKKFKRINLIHRNINFLIPELWEIKTINELSAEIKDGPMGFQLHNYDYVEKGIPVIRVQNLKDLSVTKEYLCYISEAKHNELKKSQVKPNDIIISKTGARLGVIGIVPLNYGPANLNQALARISLKDNGISQYVATYLSSQIPQKILSVVGSGRTAQPGLRMSDIKELQIPIPPKEERDRIMSFLQGVDRKLRNNQMYKANLYILKKGLMQNLLTGKIRVKV